MVHVDVLSKLNSFSLFSRFQRGISMDLTIPTTRWIWRGEPPAISVVTIPGVLASCTSVRPTPRPTAQSVHLPSSCKHLSPPLLSWPAYLLCSLFLLLPLNFLILFHALVFSFLSFLRSLLFVLPLFLFFFFAPYISSLFLSFIPYFSSLFFLPLPIFLFPFSAPLSYCWYRSRLHVTMLQ